MKFLRSILILVILAACVPAAGQQAASPAVTPPSITLPSVTPAEAQRALDVLQDDAKRRQLIETLQTIAKASPPSAGRTGASANPNPAARAQPAGFGRQILTELSDSTDRLARQLGRVAKAGADLPLLLPWLIRFADNPAARAQLANLLAKLALILACGLAVELLLARLLRAPYRGLERRSPPFTIPVAGPDGDGPIGDGPIGDSLTGDAETTLRSYRWRMTWRGLRRLPFAVGGFVIEILPIIAFAVIANLLTATDIVGSSRTARMAILVVVNAYVIFKAIMCVTRLLVSQDHPRLALLAVKTENAAYIEVWVRRIAILTLFGVALANGAELLGLAPAASEALVKLVLLVVHLCLVIVVLQCRRGVANYVRAPAGSTGILANIRNRAAVSWHYIAIFLILGLWVVWAIQLEDGAARLLRVAGLTLLTLILGRLVLIVVLGSLDRVFHLHPTIVARYPGLETRANRYYPLLRSLIAVAIWLTIFVALLESWGVDAFSWFHPGRLGDRLLSALITVGVAGVVAIAIWETANAAMDRHLDRLAREERLARIARIRTLLPILRNILLITILVIFGLTVLDQIGVNIGPLLAGAGIVGVAIGFGSQKLVQDLITGLFLLLENAMQVGDWVTAGGLSGSVENLSIRTVRLRAGDGSLHIIPFSAVTAVTNTNRGVGNAAVSVNVALKEDPDRIGEILKDIAVDMRADPTFGPGMQSDLQLWGVDHVDGASMTIAGQIVCTDSGRWGVQREFNRRMKKRFEELGIEIANPRQTVLLEQGGLAEPPAAKPAAVEEKSASPAMPDTPPPSALGHGE